MIRTLYSTPGPVDFGLLVAELRSVDPTVVDANDVDGSVAVYTPEQPDETALSLVVSAHAGPPQYQPLNHAGALATLLVVQGVLPLQDAANAIGEQPEHLIAEAEAWSLG